MIFHISMNFFLPYNGNMICGDDNMVIDQIGHVLLTAAFITLVVIAVMGLGLALSYLFAEIIR